MLLSFLVFFEFKDIGGVFLEFVWVLLIVCGEDGDLILGKFLGWVFEWCDVFIELFENVVLEMFIGVFE